MFTFTPLLGAQTDSPASQSLLELDGGVKILIDVGWDEHFDAEQLVELERQAPTISIVLLTHPTVAHLGAYAHCCKHFPAFNRVPVYATTPVVSMGRTLLQDLYNSTPLASSSLPSSSLTDSTYAPPPDGEDSLILLSPPTNEDIAEYFSKIHHLKYSQPHQPVASPSSPPLDGLIITAYQAGHTLGGTIWHIQHGSESVVYAVDWNLARENVLSGAAWLGGSGTTGAEVMEQLRKPTALVCSSKGADREALGGGWRRRDDVLLDHIRAAIKQDGSVLIPCDTSARALEVAFLLERAWISENNNAENPLRRAKLYFASRHCTSTMRYARSMLEWMDESVVREFESSNTQSRSQGRNQQQDSKGSQPFDFQCLELLERPTQLQRAFASPGPKVFLASDNSLEWGFSRDILKQFSSGSENLVIFTNRIPSKSRRKTTSKATLSERILELVETRRGSISKESNEQMAAKTTSLDGIEITITEPQVSALSGANLALYQQYLARQRQRQSTLRSEPGDATETVTEAVDDGSSSSSSSDDSDSEHQGKSLITSAALNHSRHRLGLTDEELGVNVLLRRKNVHDYDVRGKKGREKIFPYVARRKRADEFGDLIRPEDYLRAEERDVTSGQEQPDRITGDDSGLGQKRKWGSKPAGPSNGRGRFLDGSNKRLKDDDVNLRSGQGPAGTNIDNTEEDESEESDYEPAEPTISGPTRVTFNKVSLRLALKIAWVDFSGIHDRRSLQMLIPLIQARKLILTGGTEQETALLADDCRRIMEQDANEASGVKSSDVFVPLNGQVIDASVDTNAWTIKLSQTLFRNLNWQHFRNLGIVTINGQLEMPSTQPADEDGDENRKRVKLQEDHEQAQDKKTPSADLSATEEAEPPVLNTLPPALAATTRSTAQSIHVGDLRLAELRKLMQSTGHTAEFKGEGTLLVDGLIAVRKTGVGRLEIEAGGPSKTGINSNQLGHSFFTVKRQIYEGLAVVAAR